VASRYGFMRLQDAGLNNAAPVRSGMDAGRAVSRLKAASVWCLMYMRLCVMVLCACRTPV